MKGNSMLDFALNHQEELIRKLRATWMDDRYKFYHASCLREDPDIEGSTWSYHQFVSVRAHDVIGMVDYRIDRASNFVYGLGIINFEDKPSATFSKDLRDALRDIFEKYAFRRLEWSVIVGNPIEKSYDGLCARYGGRVVGTYKNRIKLLDGQFYDEKFYEIERKDYLKKIKRLAP